MDAGSFHAPIAPHIPGSVFTVRFEGQKVKTGLIESRTVTRNECIAELPLPSTAVYVTKVVPNGKTYPGEILLVNDATVQLSIAAGGAHAYPRLQFPPNVNNSMSLGPLRITGASLSRTVTVN